MTDSNPQEHSYTSTLTGLRLLTHLGPVQFVDGRYTTADQELAAEVDKLSGRPNLAITKEKR